MQGEYRRDAARRKQDGSYRSDVEPPLDRAGSFSEISAISAYVPDERLLSDRSRFRP